MTQTTNVRMARLLTHAAGRRLSLLARTLIPAAGLYGSACAPPRVAPPVPSEALPPFPEFTNQPDTGPTISSGRAGWPIMPADPNVYLDDEGYHLFYTTLFCRREQDAGYSWDPTDPTPCDIMHTFTSIAYAFSGDRGLTWAFRQTPVIPRSDSGFDGARIETAAAFRRGDTLYLAYSADGYREGRRFTARYQIGLARLLLDRQSVRLAMMDDSRKLERRPTPLLPFDLRPGRFDHNVQEPSVVIGPDGIVLYYIGLGLRLPGEPVGAAGQGIASIGLGRAVLDQQLNVVERSSSAVLLGVNSTEVRYFDHAYHLFATTLSVAPAHRGEAISYATSADGVHWTEPRVTLSPGPVAGFNEWGLTSPSAAVEPGRVVLFYSAFGTTPGDCVLLGKAGRFGLPLADEARCLFATTGRAVAARAAPRPRTSNALR